MSKPQPQQYVPMATGGSPNPSQVLLDRALLARARAYAQKMSVNVNGRVTLRAVLECAVLKYLDDVGAETLASKDAS